MKPALEHILIIKMSSMGDILHTLPSLCALRDAYPSSRISWLVDERFAGLLRDHPAVDSLFLARAPSWVDRLRWRDDVPRGLFHARVWSELRHERFDAVFDFQGLLKSAITGWLCRTPLRVGSARAREGAPYFYHRAIPASGRHHVIEQNLDLVEAVAGPTSSVRFDLVPDAASRAQARQLLADLLLSRQEPYFVVAPRSSRAFKDWPIQRYRELLLKIQKRYQLPALIVGGRKEESACRWLASHAGRKARVIVGQPLGTLMALIEQAEAFIGGDSGPLHLAGALGTKAIGLFGPTSLTRLYPWNSPAFSLSRTEGCRACRLPYAWRTSGMGRRHSCMERIEVADVLEALDRAFLTPPARHKRSA